MKYTTIDKDDPGTWPPDAAVRIRIETCDSGPWEHYDDDDADTLRAAVETEPDLWHGDRWALLPEPEEIERLRALSVDSPSTWPSNWQCPACGTLHIEAPASFKCPCGTHRD